MYILPALLGLISLKGIAAFEIPSIFQHSKRQDVNDVTVNLPNDAADAMKNFFDDKANFYSCPENLGGPPPDAQQKKRQDTATDYGCFYNVGKAAVAAVTESQGLQSLYKSSQDIIINYEFPTFQDAKTQEAFAAHLLAGAKMLETSYPGTKSDTSNRILSAIFLATHAKIIAQATYFGYFGVAKEYLKDNNGNNGHCPELYGHSIDCDNPLCNGRAKQLCDVGSQFYGCPCVPFVCPDESDTPYCDDCGGDNGGSHCKGIPEENDKYKDCRCLLTQNPPPFVESQHGFEDIAGKVDKLPNNGGDHPAEPDPSNPSCKGLDAGKWVARDPAMDAAENDFCKDPARLKSEGASDDDLKNGRINSDAWYNHDQKDDMHLKITWYQNGEITYDECVSFFRSIIDDCDKDDPKNPGNVKHGGSWTHLPGGSSSKVAVIELNPSGGRYRNDCYGLDSDKWLADFALGEAINDFCPQAFDSKEERFQATYNGGHPNEVILVADWAQDTRDQYTCHEALRLLKDNCGSTTLEHGPSGGEDGPGNYKHGGFSVPNGRAIFAIRPQRNAYCASNKDVTCGSDDDCKDIWCASGTSWYSASCLTQIRQCHCVWATCPNGRQV